MLATAALATACAQGAARPAPAPSFFVMRHLQKATGDDPGLTPEGQACAQRLSAWLSNRGISAIYASTTRRARETAAPVAAATRVTAQDYAPADSAALAARVLAETGSVLVVGHSNTVPDIVERLGGTRPAPIDESRFGEVWQVSRNGGATTMTRIPGC